MIFTARWGPLGFTVNERAIVPVEDISTSVEIKDSSETDADGNVTARSYKKEPQKINLKTIYMQACGRDPRAKWEEWCSHLGEAYPLMLGGKRFGPPKMQLVSAKLSDVKLSNFGDMLSAEVQVRLLEYAEPEPQVTAAEEETSGSTSAETTTDTTAKTTDYDKTEKEAAMNCTAPNHDRPTMKCFGL